VWSPSRIAKERIAKRRSKVGARIDQWPLVGASIALFLIIMVSQGTASQVCRMTVADLPLAAYAASQPKAIREDAINITVTRDGAIFFRNAKIGPEELTVRISGAMREGAERKAYLTVDVRSKYYNVEAVLDQIRSTGITQICVLAEKRVTQ
jgi:biopolymer transport protein ExbD